MDHITLTILKHESGSYFVGVGSDEKEANDAAVDEYNYHTDEGITSIEEAEDYSHKTVSPGAAFMIE